MAMTNAVGNMSSVVLIVAIDKLEDEDFIHYEVSGLTSNYAIGECGHLLLSKNPRTEEAIMILLMNCHSKSQLYYKRRYTLYYYLLPNFINTYINIVLWW